LVKALLAAVALAALATPAAAAEPRWTMVRTPSLTVIGDQSPNALRDVAVQIEQFRSVVAGLIHNADRPLSLPTIVFVVGDRKAMQPFVPLYNGKPMEVSGYFQGGADANVMLLSLQGFDEAASVIFHEYTHLLVRNAVRSIPTWLNEGLAEYYSGYTLEGGGKAAVIGRPLAHHVLLLRERYMPLAELLAVDRESPLYNEGSKRSIFYAESWALTHYAMTQMPDGPAAVNRYSALIAEGMAPNDAFREAFGSTPVAFDKQLRTYVRQLLFNARRVEFTDRMTVPAPGPPRTMTAGEANAWLGDLQRRVHREVEAKARIEGAMTADPSAPIAHAALGLLRLTEQREDDGIDALRRAAEMAPDDFLTQFLHGAWQLRVDDARAEPAAVASATAALKRAVAINPHSSDAYGWLAYAQMLTEASLPEARASIERAVELAPGRIDYRLRWADIRILQGAYDEAKTLLTRIAAVTVDPDAASGAKLRLERLASYDEAEAARRSARLDAASGSAPSRSIETPGIDPSKPPDAEVRLVLRKVGDGEERAYGLLVTIECTRGEVRFHVRSGDRTVTAAAKRMEDVELTQFLNEKDFTIACGARTQPETVYLTWRRDATPVAGRVGVAVSLEFLPRQYVP
jgi:tetratricopeptide (TPR) repeat protein